ncbi:raffinose/stachyose/melibiose transport system substrate-binding protein [Streptomyces sp. DSM 42143]|uniref:ABC transporter substrate-binding protein n=1 Tax=Streptomyces TaxID=1883 RepID=UPI002787FA2B|nr:MULTISPECIES: extracellular solute-binding protein [unclassified Streptomyces]MDQ0390075.1 raffinose/stachyose/melibiose transport system substrate-binding protein [Streptomyces sp. DSM 42143]
MNIPRTRSTLRRKPLLLAVTALALLAPLTACGGSDAAEGDGKTLRLWHYEQEDGALSKAWDAAIAEFKKTHPDVKVVFERKTFEQIQQNAGMILNSDKAPDVMEYNKGNATTGQLAKQGLLTDLTPLVKEHGWDRKISESASVTARYNDKGEMGGEKWYGIPNYGEFVLTYYNDDLFKKHGVDKPTDFASFEAALAKFKAAGVTPLANAGNDHPASHWLYLLALSKANNTWVDNYQRYLGKVDFHGPEMAYAVDKYQEWLDKGYFDKKDVGLKGSDMVEQFVSQKRPIMVGGNWWFGSLTTDIKNFQWSTAAYPGSERTLGSGGNNWVIPTKAKNKKLAEDFIAITMSDKIQKLIGEEGNVPLAAKPADITNPKSRQLTEAFAQTQENDGLAFYPDWPVAGYYDTWVAATQNLINGGKADSVLDELAAPYEKYVATRP